GGAAQARGGREDLARNSLSRARPDPCRGAGPRRDRGGYRVAGVAAAGDASSGFQGTRPCPRRGPLPARPAAAQPDSLRRNSAEPPASRFSLAVPLLRFPRREPPADRGRRHDRGSAADRELHRHPFPAARAPGSPVRPGRRIRPMIAALLLALLPVSPTPTPPRGPESLSDFAARRRLTPHSATAEPGRVVNSRVRLLS